MFCVSGQSVVPYAPIGAKSGASNIVILTPAKIIKGALNITCLSSNKLRITNCDFVFTPFDL